MKKLYLIIIILLVVDSVFASAYDEFQFAKKMYDDTLYEEAIGKFREIIQKYPTSSEAESSQLYIGNSYIELKLYDEAGKAFKHLVDAYPNSKLVPNAIYKLAESQYISGNYEDAALNYQYLINHYPQSPFSILSLKKVIKSFQLSEQYNEAILSASSILKHYADKPQIPDVYLLLADLYFENNMPEQFELTLDKIIIDYSSSEAKWEAIEKLALHYLATKRQKKAIELIQNKLNELIPRKYEKSLLLLYADILFKIEYYASARENYQSYFRKFDTEPNLDEVAYKIAVTNFKLSDYKVVLQNCSDFKIEFPESKSMAEVYFLMGQTYYKLLDYQMALQELDSKNFINASKKIKFQVLKLKTEIFEHQNLYEKVITDYLNLIQNFSDLVSADSCYFHIASIYQKILNNYESAINYYQMILNTYPQTKLWQKIQIEMADCFENMEQYEKSLKILQLTINQGNLSAEMEKKIKQNIEYIKKYKIKEKDAALESLMDCFISYIRNNDKIEALASIIKIYRDDLKEYEKAIEIFKQNKYLENNPEFLLLQGETYQSLAIKLEYENDVKTEIYLQKAKETFENIINNFIEVAETPYAKYYLIELNLRQYEIGSDIYIKKLEEYSSEFVQNYSSFPKIGNVYFNLAKSLILSYGEEQAIIRNLQQAITLSKNKIIKNSAYSLLGDIYLENESYQAALNQFNKIDSEIIFKNSNLLFNIAFAEMKLNHLTESAEYFQNFVNNFKLHKKYWEGVKNLAEIYKELNLRDKAISYYQLLVENQPDDIILRELRNLYISNQKFENAIEVSIKIQERTNEDRRILAEVYLQKGAKSLAILQYEKVIENETDVNKKLKDIEQLAMINFNISDFQEAIEGYEKIINLTADLKNRFSDIQNLDWSKIGENLIISCYKRKSRKNAEEYEKIFNKVIKDNNEIKSHLLLEKGIYYINLDNKKANKIFDEIIEDYNYTDYADNAYFQQALMALEDKNFELAKDKLKSLIEHFPESELVNNANLKLGSINFTDGHFRKALEYYQLVIQSDREGELALKAIENFALTCKSMGEWMLAIEAYQMLLDKFGTPEIKPQTLFEIAFCFYRDKKYQKAIELFQTIFQRIDKRSTKVEIIYWIGESYFGLEEYEKVVETLLKIVYNYSDFAQWDVNANIKIAMAYEQLNKFDKARLFYNSVIKKYGEDSQWGKEAKKLLDALP
ncbi:MAG: tetratricopeptide repeat protein [Candidatus Cloacimonetes bacterium]|nr:tetratricopeptide repeat protein [Candidatus Cloacimonadota bacterium]